MVIDGLPGSDEEIGEVLRRLRGRRSLRALVNGSTFTKSALARYEAGAAVPLVKARELDRLYGADGWIHAAVASVGAGRWQPWLDEAPRRHFAHAWPQQFAGLVWLRAQPAPLRVGQPHHLVVRWGRWVRVINAVLPRHGTAFVTGKADDPEPTSCTVECTPDAYVLFGVNEPAGDYVDIRHGWKSP